MDISKKILQTACNCDKTPTLTTIFFELWIFVGTLLAFTVLSRFKKNILKHYLIVIAGVAVFEIFTAPMWSNSHLGAWAYIYKDVSWILNMGWATLILSAVILVDAFFNKLSGWKRFLIYLAVLTPLVYLLESFVVFIGIRAYSPEVLQATTGIKLLGIPVEGFYYIPVFISLIIGFYKYWAFMLEKLPIVPYKKIPFLRKFIISFVGVFLFELMIEPMVTNAKLPAWSYIYRDISFIMSGIWIIIIWLSVSLVDKFFIQASLAKKFILYVAASSLFAIPIEAWFINNGYRIYGPTATANFTGLKTLIFHLPIEVIFAVPMYLVLIIGFIKFWEIILDNKS